MLRAGWFAIIIIVGAEAYGQGFGKAIEDNSFLIEEAYNQEAGVVQNIGSGYLRNGDLRFLGTFTQEWPIGGQTHQLSYSLLYLALDGGTRGIGDIALNYRYQLSASEDPVAMAPRFSILIPVGDFKKGLGAGVLGAQAALPASKRWTDDFITHANVGLTLLPRSIVSDDSGTETRTTFLSPFAGASAIWLLTDNLNILCEVLRTWYLEFGEGGEQRSAAETIIDAGIRFAVNVGEVQIVPGIAFTLAMAEQRSLGGAFFYLSIENPF